MDAPEELKLPPGCQVTLANRSRKWQRLGEGQPGGDHRGYRVSLSSPSSWWSWRPCWSPAEYWLSGRSHRDRRSAAVGVSVVGALQMRQDDRLSERSSL